MFIPRVIPCLLLQGRGIVKTIQSKNSKYIGDPINAVKIFNAKAVDELIFLDISASQELRQPHLNVISDIASQCFMPFCYGGGIKNLAEIKTILFSGAEKVAINSLALETPHLVRQFAEEFGSQSIVISIDVKKKFFNKYRIYNHVTRKTLNLDPVQFAMQMEELGAGEILLNSVDRDGTMTGYDIDLIKSVSDAVNIPVIACGGAGKIDDIRQVIKTGGASAAAAGSLFVFYGKHSAVLINYPSQEELNL